KKIMVMMTHRTEGPAAPREFLTNQPFVRLENALTNGQLRIETYTSHVAGVRAKVVVSSGEEFSRIAPTNDAPGSVAIPRSENPAANPESLADLELVKTGITGPGGVVGGGWFASSRASWRYEARLFSHLLNVLAYG